MHVCDAMRYSFPFQGFVRDLFSYYQHTLGQLHPNRQTIMSSFKKSCKMVGLEPLVNCFRSFYQLVAETDDGNDMRWFFTFANKSNGAIQNILTKKPMSNQKMEGKMACHKIFWDSQSLRGITVNLRLFPPLKGPSVK